MKLGIPVLFFATCLAITLAPQVHAQHTGHDPARHGAATPYAGQQAREVKSMSADELRALRAGQGMGLARPAELGSHPGPMHVLELADALALSTEQRQQTEALIGPMKEKAIRYGTFLIAKEQELDRLFERGGATPAQLQTLLMEAAELQAQVRLAHLETHLAQVAILTPAQIQTYNKLRGYGVVGAASPRGADAPAHHPGR